VEELHLQRRESSRTPLWREELAVGERREKSEEKFKGE
jgi:hypothetical protein